MKALCLNAVAGARDRPAERVAAWLMLLGTLLTPLPLTAQGLSLTDPSLIRPLREAVGRSNPALTSSRAEIQAAQARLRAAGLAPPAVLSAEIEDVPDGYDVTGAAIRLEVGREFLTGGRGAASRALTAADLRSAEADLYALERRLDARVGRELARTLAQLAIARRLAAEDSLLVAAESGLRARFAVGDARYVDVLRLRTERLRVQNERSETLAEAQAARFALGALAGGVRRQQLAPGPVETEFNTAAGIAPGGIAGGTDDFMKVEAGRVAREAVKGFERARPLVLPGRTYRLVMAAGALAPARVKRRMAVGSARRMRGMEMTA